MYRAIYIGNRREELFNKNALLIDDKANEFVKAQFNVLFLPEAFGWHEFLRNEFVNIEKIG